VRASISIIKTSHDVCNAVEHHNTNGSFNLREPLLLDLDDHHFFISDDDDEMSYTSDGVIENDNACFQELCTALRHNHPEETYVYVATTTLTDERASELGGSLMENNNTTVTRMDIPLDHLTSTGNYNALLDFCATSPSLTTVKLSTDLYGTAALANNAAVTTRFLEALFRNAAHPNKNESSAIVSYRQRLY